MRYSQIKAFHHVALLGGFSRAAEDLLLTQPAISEQVKKLEQTHDTLLFKRDRKRVTLTPEGERLFHFTKRFFEVEQQMDEYLSSTRAALAGELSIIADSAHHITRVLSAFRKRYPNVTVSLRTGNTEDILSELRAYNAEIGVVGGLARDRTLEFVSLGATRIIAFAAPGVLPASQHSLSLQDLTRWPLIFREAGSKTRQKLEEEARRRGIVLKPAIVAEGREAVREVVASGAGIGFVSQAEYGHDSRIDSIPLSDVDLEMDEFIVHLTQRRDVRVIRAFMELARTQPGEAAP